MSYLKLVQPITVTPSMLTSSTVPEDDYAAWAVGTTYALAARVIYDHDVYESLQGSNTGKTPDEQPLWWVRVGPCNRWRAFDASPSTLTTRTGSIQYVIAPGQIVNSVVMLGLVANTVRVRMTDPTDGVVYDKTQDVSGWIDEPDWWTYFFGEVIPQSDALFLDLPTYGTASLTIDIDAGAGDASVGVVIIGKLRVLDMQVRYGAEVGIVDFSRKERDDFGDVQLIQRGFARRVEFPCLVGTSSVDQVVNTLASVRGTPCLWIGTEKTKTTIVYGWFNDFSVQIAYPQISYSTIEIEGLV